MTGLLLRGRDALLPEARGRRGNTAAVVLAVQALCEEVARPGAEWRRLRSGATLAGSG